VCVCVRGGGGGTTECKLLLVPADWMFWFFSMKSVNTFTNNYRKPSIIVMGEGGGGSLQVVYVTGIPVEHKVFHPHSSAWTNYVL